MRDTRAFIDRLCDPLRTPGKRTWFLVQPYSRGDTYLTCALIEAFRATHGTVTDDLVLLVKRGLPMAAESIIVQGAYFTLLAMVNAYGAATAAAYAASAQLWAFVQLPSNALAAAMSAMAAICS